MSRGRGRLCPSPDPDPNLIFKLEGRVDAANEALFQKGTTGSSFIQGTTTLGVVATTN